MVLNGGKGGGGSIGEVPSVDDGKCRASGSGAIQIESDVGLQPNVREAEGVGDLLTGGCVLLMGEEVSPTSALRVHVLG